MVFRARTFGTCMVVAAMLAGCGKQIPSCGDVEATKLVNNILADLVLKELPAMDEKLKRPVSFTVDQPVIVGHDEKLGTYSCKATAIYQVPEVLVRQVFTNNNQEYKQLVQLNWIRLLNLDSNGMLQSLSRLGEAMAVGQKNDNKVSLDVAYTIAKIDGKDQFQVSVTTKDTNLLEGIRSLEVLQAATLYTDSRAANGKQTQAQAPEDSHASSDQVPTQEAVTQEPTRTANAEDNSPSRNDTPGAPDVPKQAPEQAVASKQVNSPEIQASFDCEKANSTVEKLICSTPEAASSDKRMAAAYVLAKENSSDAKALRTEQITWAKEVRNVCSDVACLIKVNETRIQKLNSQ